MNTDCLIVLGGGIKDVHQLSQSTVNRLDAALQLHTGTETILVAGAGPVHSPPPVDERGFPVFESVGAIRYLIDQGVETDQLLYETSSYDTIGNAYFSRFIHIQHLPVQHLTIITSNFHLPRTKLIFDWIYGLSTDQPYVLEYVGVDDSHLDPQLLESHRQKELDRMNQLQALLPGLQTVTDLHDWIFHHHQAYIAHQQPVKIVTDVEQKRLLEQG